MNSIQELIEHIEKQIEAKDGREPNAIWIVNELKELMEKHKREDEYSVEITDEDIEYDKEVLPYRDAIFKAMDNCNGIIKVDLIGMWALMDVMKKMVEEKGQQFCKKLEEYQDKHIAPYPEFNKKWFKEFFAKYLKKETEKT